jgi:hypothetical protein
MDASPPSPQYHPRQPNRRRFAVRRVIVSEFVSLDGVIESPEKWHFPYWSDEMGEYKSDELAAADALLWSMVRSVPSRAASPGCCRSSRATDGKTFMAMVQRGFPSAELRDEHRDGLPNAFARLEQATEERVSPLKQADSS